MLVLSNYCCYYLLVALNVTQGWLKNNLFYLGHISSVAVQQHQYTCCVWMSDKVSSEHVELCMLLSSPSCLWVYDWHVSGLSWLPRPQWERWKRWRRGPARVCHSSQAFLFLTRILTPVLSITISRWLTKELLSYRQVHTKTVGVSVSLYCTVLERLTLVLQYKIMPCHRFARSAFPRSHDRMLQC